MFLDQFIHNCREFPQSPAVTELQGFSNARQQVTYGELLERATDAADEVTGVSHRGDRVLVRARNSINTVATIVGIMLAGRIPVPVSPAAGRYARGIVSGIVADCGAAASYDERSRDRKFAPIRDKVSANDHSSETTALPSREQTDTIAFLQYTSGSTSRPKGVVVTNTALGANIASMSSIFQNDVESRMLCWLPLHHDMGLVGNIFYGLASGSHIFLASPSSFNDDPFKWVRAISDLGITHAGGPSSAYAMAAVAMGTQEPDGIDLSLWTSAYCGAEPISLSALKEFQQKMERFGFQPESFIPCYGLAEATLMVAARHGIFASLKPGAEAGCGFREVVSVGHPVDTEVRIVPQSHGNGIGVIEVRGPAISQQYWGHPVRPAAWFRTADIGFLLQNELFVIGRTDDVLVVGGRNVYLGDIEAFTTDHLGLGPAVRVVALDDGEGLVRVIIEQASGSAGDLAMAIARQFGVSVSEVQFRRAGTIPRTTSGKPRRAALKAEFAGEVPDLPAPAKGWMREFGIRGDNGVDADRKLSELGMTSLSAMRIVEAVRDHTHTEVSIGEVLREWTLGRLEEVIDGALLEEIPAVAAATARGGAADDAAPAILESLSMSETEQAMAFLHYMTPQSDAYLLNFAALLPSAVDVSAFVAAAEAELRLRPRLGAAVNLGEQGFEYVQVPRDGQWWKAELRDMPNGASWDEMRATVRLAGLEKRNAATRLILWRSEQGHILQIATDHVHADQWSLAVLMKAVNDRYVGKPQVPSQAYDSCLAQSSYLESRKADAYLDRLTDRYRATGDRGRLITDLDPAPKQRRRLAGRNALDLQGINEVKSSEVVAAWLLTLSAFSESDSIAVGLPVAGRAAAGALLDVRLHTNTLPVMARIDPKLSVSGFLTTVEEQILDAVENGQMPLSRIVRRLKPARTADRDPLFDSLVTVHAEPVPGVVGSDVFVDASRHQPLVLDGLELRPVSNRSVAARADLDLAVFNGPPGAPVRAILDYDEELFSSERASSILHWFETVLNCLRLGASDPLGELQLIPKQESQIIMRGANSATETLEVDVIESLRRFASSDTVAVQCGGVKITFRELNQKVDAAAATLARKAGKAVDQRGRIGIMLPGGIAFVVAMFACWSAGLAIVPIATTYPERRIREILADAGVDIVVFADSDEETNGFNARSWEGEVVTVTKYGDIVGRGVDDVGTVGSEATYHFSNDAEAFVVYTSGSTGVPKGVAVKHSHLDRHIRWFRDRFNSGPGTRIAQTLSLGFDFGLQEIFTTVPFGASLIVPTGFDRSSARRYAEFLQANGVTVLFSTPTFASQLTATGLPMDSLRHVLLGGEVLRGELVRSMRQVIDDDCVIYNGYGPTECTVNVLVQSISYTDSFESIVPVGAATSGATIAIEGPQGLPRPVGILGEIVIGGPGVVEGYLNNPEQTLQRFEMRGASWRYRTGDRAYWDRSGRVVVVGRNDRQVKVNGYRVELDEVQSIAAEIVDTGFVHVEAIGAHARVVCFVLDEKAVKRLETELPGRLPEWSVPDQYVVIDKIPTTENGKLDVEALSARALGERQVTPPTEWSHEGLRAAVLTAWSEELAVPALKYTDNVFDQGAHSLAAIRVHDRLMETIGERFPPYFLFEHPTADELSAAIWNQKTSGRVKYYE